MARVAIRVIHGKHIFFKTLPASAVNVGREVVGVAGILACL